MDRAELQITFSLLRVSAFTVLTGLTGERDDTIVMHFMEKYEKYCADLSRIEIVQKYLQKQYLKVTESARSPAFCGPFHREASESSPWNVERLERWRKRWRHVLRALH